MKIKLNMRNAKYGLRVCTPGSVLSSMTNQSSHVTVKCVMASLSIFDDKFGVIKVYGKFEDLLWQIRRFSQSQSEWQKAEGEKITMRPERGQQNRPTVPIFFAATKQPQLAGR